MWYLGCFDGHKHIISRFFNLFPDLVSSSVGLQWSFAKDSGRMGTYRGYLSGKSRLLSFSHLLVVATSGFICVWILNKNLQRTFWNFI